MVWVVAKWTVCCWVVGRVYIYIYIGVRTRKLAEDKVLNIVDVDLKTVKITLTSAQCETVFHILR